MKTRLLAHVALAVVAGAGCLSVRPGEDGRVHSLSDDYRATLPRAAVAGEQLPAVPERERIDEVRVPFEKALGADAGSRIRHDPGLDQLARVIAVAYGETKQRLSTELLHWVHWRAGGTARIEGSSFAWASGGGRAGSIDESIVGFARRAPTEGKLRYGLARLPLGARIAAAVVWVNDELSWVKPVPLTLAPGSTLPLQARFAGALERVRVNVGYPDGTVRTMSVEKGAKTTAFVMDLELTQTGVHMLEIVSEQPGHARDNLSLAWWPVYVGVEPPASEPGGPVGNTAPTPEAVEAHVRALRGDGFGPLERDPVLDKLAADSIPLEHHDQPPDDDGCRRDSSRMQSASAAMEELAWRHQLSPHARAMVRDPDLARLGIALAPADDDKVEAAFLLCARAPGPASPPRPPPPPPPPEPGAAPAPAPGPAR